MVPLNMISFDQFILIEGTAIAEGKLTILYEMFCRSPYTSPINPRKHFKQ